MWQVIPLDGNGGFQLVQTGVRHKADTTTANKADSRTVSATASNAIRTQSQQRSKEQEEQREYKPPERTVLVGILLTAVCMLATAIIGYIVLIKKQH